MTIKYWAIVSFLKQVSFKNTQLYGDFLSQLHIEKALSSPKSIDRKTKKNGNIFRIIWQIISLFK